MPLQIRRGLDAERTGLTTPLVIGELLYVTDQGRLYIGDGTNLGAADSAGNANQGGKGLSITGFTAEDAQDAAATMFGNGTHSNIVFSYNDNANAFSAQVDLSTYTGNINVVNGIVDADFRGSVFADNSTLLVDAVSGSIPYAILSGAPTQVSQFANDIGYIRVADIADGTVTIDVNNTGDLQGSVFGDDSTLLVDAVNSTIPAAVVTGTFTGNVVGDVVGIVTGQAGSSLIGTVTGTMIGDLKGSVFADNSSIMVDAVSNIISTSELNTDSIVAANNDLSVRTPSGSVILGSTSANINSNLFINRTEFTGTDTAGICVSQSHSFSPNVDALNFRRSRGSLASPSVVQLGDVLGEITFNGHNNNSTVGAGGYKRSMIMRVTSEFINSNTITSNLVLLSANPAGTIVPRMRFSSDGRLLIGPNLTTDATGERVGIEIYQTLNAGTAASIGQPITIRQYFDGVDANNFTVQRYRGTRSVNNAVITGDRIFDFTFQACDGGGLNSVANSSRIGLLASGIISGGIVPGTISLDTADQSGTLLSRVQIKEDGILYALYGIEGDITGSVFSDSSTMLIDGTSGSIMIANVNLLGETGNVPLTPGSVDSWLEVTVNGNTKYIPLHV